MSTFRSMFTSLLLCATSVAAAEMPVRLSTTVAPLFQAIQLDLDPLDETYEGSTRFAIRITEPTRNFRLHAEEMTIESVVLEGTAGAVPVEFDLRERGELLIRAARTLDPDDYTLTVDFSNDYGSRTVGLYKVEAGDESSLYTQFQPNDAREAIPTWDEPLFKIPFELEVTIPEGFDAVSNTPIAAVREENGDRTIAFERTMPLPSYLLALAVGKFDYVPIEGMSIPGRVVVPDGKKELGRLAAEMTPPLLRAMEAYFDLRYPYEKVDLISVPEFWAGAMENAGAITFRETILLLDPETASVQEKRILAKVIAHELAHMWFGDLVTMEWWNDLWLNESFADWFGDRIVEKVYPEYQVELSELESVHRTMSRDAQPSTAAVRQSIEDPDAVLNTVGLAYNKGKGILTMFERWIGEDRFREGLRQHMREQAWGTATSDEFFATLSEAAGFDIEPSMRTFLDQSSLPLIRLERQDGGIVLSQERYADYGLDLPPRAWIVPVVLTWGREGEVESRRIVLDELSRAVELETEGAWIYPDLDATGYYRWVMPEEELLNLARLAEEIMTPRQRLAFAGNAVALLSAGEIDGGTFLDLMQSIADDSNPVVAEYVLGALMDFLEQMRTDENEDEIARYVRNLLREPLEAYGREARSAEPDVVASLRPRLLLWLGTYGADGDTRAWAAREAPKILEGVSTLSPDLRSAALRLAAIDGTEALLQRYVRTLEESKDPNLRSDLLRAVGEFRDPDLSELVLDYALEGPLKSTEILLVASGTVDDDASRARLWSWVQKHHDELVRRLPPQSVPALVTAAGDCSDERLREAETFFQGARLHPGTERRLARLRDEVRECAALRQRELSAVNAYLAGGQARSDSSPVTQ